jgi:tRNA1(Val) A37 N6-methylase TrmN6
MPEPDEVSEDALLDGRVRLLQLRRGHRAGTDAVLLAAAAEVAPGEMVADVGAGTGAVGLMTAARVAEVRLVFVEREPALAALCRQNVELNGHAERARVVEADVLAPAAAAGLPLGEADVVVSNPPYLDAARSRRSPDAARARAHELPEGGLVGWLVACATLVRPKGRLVLIHRADRIDEVLRAMPRGFGGVALRFVHPRADAPATRVLVSARKGSRAPLTVRPPLILHDGARFTEEAGAMHRGDAVRSGGPRPAQERQ